MVYSSFAVGGVEEHLRIASLAEASVPEGAGFDIQVGAGPDTSDFEMPESMPNALTRLSTLRVETRADRPRSPREQRLIDPPSSDGKNDPVRSFDG